MHWTSTEKRLVERSRPEQRWSYTAAMTTTVALTDAERAYLQSQPLGRLRGIAVALSDVNPPVSSMSREIIRITPTWVTARGLDPDGQGRQTRRGT